MQYTKLGGTGITVSRFALGAMSMGALGNTDHDDAHAAVSYTHLTLPTIYSV